MKLYTAIIYCTLFTLLLCNGCQRRVQDVELDESTDSYTEYKCFAEGFSADGYERMGNELVYKTDNGSCLKYTAVNDSEYVFACGKENREFTLYKGKCAEHINAYRLEYDNEYMIILYEKAGSDSWQYTYVNFRDKTVKREQSIYLDTESMWHVDWFEHDNKVYLTAFNEHYNTSHTVLTKYRQLRTGGGFPQFYIRNVYVQDTSIFYSVENDYNELSRDSISLFDTVELSSVGLN